MSQPDELIEKAWEAAEQGLPEEALALARQALEEAGSDPEAQTVAGWALLEMGRGEEAVEALGEAVRADPENAEAWSLLGEARFEVLDLTGAGEAIAHALELDEKLAHAHWLRGLVAERLGNAPEAEEAFRAAGRIDRESFPTPFRVGAKEFGDLAEQAMERLPASFRKELKNLAVIIEEIPPAALLSGEPALSPTLLGLHAGGGGLPDTIHLFQRNLERAATSREELVEEIETTLLHEIGHYLGLDEDEVAERGLE